MDKSPEAFRTISEVAEALNVPPHVLRFWESRFTQVKPVKRGGGRRYYRPEDVRLLRGIRGLLYDDGMTIKGVQKILRERGVRHVVGLGTLPDGADEAPPAPHPAAHRKPAAPKPATPRAARAKAPPSPRSVATPEPAATRGPQGDLFAGTGVAEIDAPPRVRDKAALRALLAELQALRDTMMVEPGA